VIDVGAHRCVREEVLVVARSRALVTARLLASAVASVCVSFMLAPSVVRTMRPSPEAEVTESAPPDDWSGATARNVR
jgi:hypothetical protein